MRKSTALIILIPLALAFYFVYVAIGWNIIVSFSDWKGLLPSYGFQGFAQYGVLFNDPTFWQSLVNNLFLFSIIPGSIGLGLLLAILLDQRVRGAGVFRTIYLLPFALSFVVTATMWAWMYDPSSGTLNTLLNSFGLGFLTSPWHTQPGTVMFAIILALMWQFSGYTMVILLAGIKSIPLPQIQAAKIDRASGFRLYRKVVIPQLKVPILTAFVVLMIFALKTFDFIWVLTSGGPGYASHTMPIMLFREAFQASKFAYGAAIGNILLAVVLLIVIPYMYKFYRRR
ncbi:Diacetylchitobiose uptake system permease protein NgcF [subsurface metagenome]